MAHLPTYPFSTLKWLVEHLSAHRPGGAAPVWSPTVALGEPYVVAVRCPVLALCQAPPNGGGGSSLRTSVHCAVTQLYLENLVKQQHLRFLFTSNWLQQAHPSSGLSPASYTASRSPNVSFRDWRNWRHPVGVNPFYYGFSQQLQLGGHRASSG